MPLWESNPWPDNIPGGTWHPGKLSHTTSFGAQDLSAHRAHPGRQTAMPAEEPRLWVAKAVRRGLRARHLRWQRVFRRGLGLSEQRPAFDSRPDAAGHLYSGPRVAKGFCFPPSSFLFPAPSSPSCSSSSLSLSHLYFDLSRFKGLSFPYTATGSSRAGTYTCHFSHVILNLVAKKGARCCSLTSRAAPHCFHTPSARVCL